MRLVVSGLIKRIVATDASGYGDIDTKSFSFTTCLIIVKNIMIIPVTLGCTLSLH